MDEQEKIQKIREQYDELADKIVPHITLAFPFDREFSNEFLMEKFGKEIMNLDFGAEKPLIDWL